MLFVDVFGSHKCARGPEEQDDDPEAGHIETIERGK